MIYAFGRASRCTVLYSRRRTIDTTERNGDGVYIESRKRLVLVGGSEHVLQMATSGMCMVKAVVI